MLDIIWLNLVELSNLEPFTELLSMVGHQLEGLLTSFAR